MKRPRNIRLDGRRYRIRFERPNDLVSQYCGRVLHAQCRITIGLETPGRAQREILLHEVTHAIVENRGLGLEEAAVTALSNGLFAFLRDNPEATKWILEEKHGTSA